MPYYGYHPRIKQRIRAGELIGYHWDDNYPRSGGPSGRSGGRNTWIF